MGVVAGAFGVSHILLSPDGCEDEAEVVFEGYLEVGRRVRAHEPDVLVVISGDHMQNLDTAIQVPLGVGIGDTWMPYGDMGVPKVERPGHRDFAEGMVRALSEEGFDPVKFESDGFRPDHGFSCPLLFSDPSSSTPFVPLFVDVNMDPVLSPGRCYQLGDALRRYIVNGRPDGERTVVIATGGLSHWLFVEGHGRVAEDFDLAFLDALCEGRAADYRDLSYEQIRDQAGNGGLEIMYWLLMAACAGNGSGEKIFYQPVWNGGLAALEVST